MRKRVMWLAAGAAIGLTMPGSAQSATDASSFWPQWRGPHATGVSTTATPPVEWSETKNVRWKVTIPGRGSASPVIWGDRVYLTCYTGYGLEASKGNQQDLRRHLFCFDRKSGKERWSKSFEPKLPEHEYQGEGAYHGYAASTPVSVRPLRVSAR